MLSDALARHTVARLMAGRPLPLQGRLLSDRTESGDLVPLDPDTGAELSTDSRPAFVLSTEDEASDGHIVRQHWDLSRAADSGPGVPVLWNHSQDALLGRWEDLRVQDLAAGPALVGRVRFDPEDPTAQLRAGQIKRGFLSAVSVGWVPGEATRRGELPDDDPHRREAGDDPCGLPSEGLVMGSERSPNHLIEASLVTCPAQPTAVVVERFHRAGAHDLAEMVRGHRGAAYDPDRLLSWLAQEPRVRAWVESLVVRAVRRASPSASPEATASFLDRLFPED